MADMRSGPTEYCLDAPGCHNGRCRLHRGYFEGGRIKSTHAAVLLLLVPAACSTQETFPGTFQATVIGVSDGDTMSVKLADGTVERLRFQSIDAPESDQPFGEEATQFVEAKAMNREATVTASGRDQYQRLIAKIEVQGEDLSTELLKAGLAWWFYHYSDELDLAAIEAESKANRRGLFASDTPIYPRIWRRGARIPEPTSDR